WSSDVCSSDLREIIPPICTSFSNDADEISSPHRSSAQRLGALLSWMGDGELRARRELRPKYRRSLDAGDACIHARPITLGPAHAFIVPFCNALSNKSRKLETEVRGAHSHLRGHCLGNPPMENACRCRPG